MAKKLKLTPHLSEAALKKHYRSSKDPIESRRFHLLWLMSPGQQLPQAATVVGLSHSYARKVVKAYNEHGIESLNNGLKQKRGARSDALLSPEQQEKLRAALDEPPEDGGQWSGPKVARWIEKETGRAGVWNQRGWDYLKKLKYSWQRPRPHHAKANIEAQQAFKISLPERQNELEAKHPEAEVEVWATDEHRVGLKPIVRKTWSPIGERPVAQSNHQYEWTYVYGFICPATGASEWCLAPRVNVKWFSQVLADFACAVGAGVQKRILLVLDGAGWHRSSKLEIPEGIALEFLPAYSPELQPAERLWSVLDEPIVNRCFETIEAIEEVLAERCRVLSSTMVECLRKLTHFHWWPTHRSNALH